jgi:uncharacterized cupredoxin-like copper-binding protein
MRLDKVSNAALATISALAAAIPTPAGAHAFGQRYDLPIPLWMFVVGAGAVVSISFAFVAVAMRVRLPSGIGTRSRGYAVPVPIVIAFQIAGVASLCLIVLAGFFGNPDPFKNIAPLAIWVVGWVGLSLICGFVGDLWFLINPWSAVYSGSEAILHRWGRPPTVFFQPPKWVGAWPAVALFLVFGWCELIWSGGGEPRQVAWLVLGYSLVTWAGMAAFSRAVWLETGEIFTIAFRLFGSFAPIWLVHDGGHVRLGVRPFASGLLEDIPYSLSSAAFLLVMLATVTFDGLSETPLWAWLLLTLQPDGGNTAIWATLGLLAVPVLLALAFAATVAFSRRLVQQGPQVETLIGYFVPTLLPISLAYHLAHNLSFLLLGLQYLIPLLSDPFGFGWDLFGTRFHIFDPSVVNTKLIWTVAICGIVVGHVIAVYLAHAVALDLFPARRVALRSQLPMLALMVCYTMISLWILAQPITNFRAAQRVERSFSAGEPGDPKQPSLTINVIMGERDGAMFYVPDRIEVRLGEQIRFVITNTGTLAHEFILATIEENEAHGRLMEKFPDMEHNDPNGKRLAPGQTSELLWKFSNPGTFEFACLIPGHHAAGMHGTVIVK